MQQFPEPWIGASVIYDGYTKQTKLYLHWVGHSVKRWAYSRRENVRFFKGAPHPMIDLWSRPEFPDAGEVQRALGLQR